MRLLSGGAGSGKTFRVVEELRQALRRRDSGVRLLTPTATMAQHLQNRLAREGFVFRAGLVQTLSRFVDGFAVETPQVSEPLLYLIVEEAARRVNRAEFAKVLGMPGFCAALARTMEEFSSAGCDAERLGNALARRTGAAPLGDAFLSVYREVDSELLRRGLATRSQRLALAAEQIARSGMSGVHTIWVDGFYALPDPELAVIEAMCRHAEVTLTLPAAAITEPTRARLLAMGFREELCERARVQPHVELCEAAGIEREADEIARRILEQNAAGRPFRDMGVIVRSQEIYEAILRTTLDRFGIPARFYFDSDLAKHPLVRHLAGVVDAMLGGWDHAETLAALRMAPGIASDEFDFAVREKLPERGLAKLPPLGEPMQALELIEGWRALSLTPAEWAARLKGMRQMFQPGQLAPGSYESAAMLRGQAAVLQSFEAAMDEAAGALPPPAVRIDAFWRVAKSVLRLTPLRVEDRRRNVVHVLGAHEARQWQLPVVFVCGLVEKQFPKFHTQDPFFPEAARAQLKQAGIRLRSAADFEQEERFLFDWAVTRGTERITLSYPKFDARGQQNLRSLFLEDASAEVSPAQPVVPRIERPERVARPIAAIASADLLEALTARHASFDPTGLETYLQCPFQFFGQRTLHLKPQPKRPEDRLNALAEGSIVHGVLAEWNSGQALEEIFERVFRRIAERDRIPATYRTEACRQRLLADLREFCANPKRGFVGETRTEQKFEFVIGGNVRIKGRIDRMDVSDAATLIIDYKYSGSANTKKKIKAATMLQPQLYVLAAERVFELRVASMQYCGLRGGVEWAGFDAPFPAGWREEAIETTLRLADAIRTGHLIPQPADADKCQYCDFRDACRFEAVVAIAAEEE